jgi:hypothetical protein
MKTLIVVLFLLSLVTAAAAPVIARNCPAVQIKKRNYFGLENEIETIAKAAERNGCRDQLFNILLAIRKAENGPPGFEFGVVRVKGTNLDRQAGWAASTIVAKMKMFYSRSGYQKWDTLMWEEFIEFLAYFYCPPTVDFHGNINWTKNVKFWFRKFEED